MNILYMDDVLVAVDKPAGLLSVPGRGGALLEKSAKKLLKEELGREIYPVHRLDRDASGVIVFALNKVEHKRLNALFETRSVKKEYFAVVHGRVTGKKEKIDLSLREYGSGRMGISDGGKESLTWYEALENFRNFTLVKVSPVTGRRHQIRVHFYGISHPLVGDRLYGDQITQEKYPRLMLHACSVAFPDKNEKNLKIESDLPPDFQCYLDRLVK